MLDKSVDDQYNPVVDTPTIEFISWHTPAVRHIKYY